MRRLLIALGLSLTLATPGFAVVVRTQDQTVPLADTQVVEVRLGVGNLKIVGSSGTDIKVHLDLRCKSAEDKDCKKAAENVGLTTKRNGLRQVIGIDGYPKLRDLALSTDLTLEVPRQARLNAHTGVGDVHVEGSESDLEIDVGVGDVSLHLVAAKLRSVELDTGVGNVGLTLNGQRIEGSGLVGKGLDWKQGTGSALVEVDTGVGDVEVILD